MGKKNPEGFRSSCTVFLNFVIPLGYVAEEIRNLELEYNYYFSDMLTQPFEPAELHALHVHVLGVLCLAIGWCTWETVATARECKEERFFFGSPLKELMLEEIRLSGRKPDDTDSDAGTDVYFVCS